MVRSAAVIAAVAGPVLRIAPMLMRNVIVPMGMLPVVGVPVRCVAVTRTMPVGIEVAPMCRMMSA
jgi:hypothetical protein